METLEAGLLDVPEACYNEPGQVSEKKDYYKSICGKLLLDIHYTAIAAKITAADGLVDAFGAAILVAATGAHGTVAARDVAQKKMTNAMDALLPDIQTVANNDPVNAITNITSLGVSYRTRVGYTRDSIEIKHGEISGSFDMYIKKPRGNFAVIFMITTTPLDDASWKLADFSQKSHGYVSGLKPGTKYYFKSMHKSSVDGTSDWTYIVDKICD